MNEEIIEGLDELNRRLKELRDKAEAHLGAGSPSAKSVPVPLDLLHELRVNRIELELQNEELRRTQAALEQAKAHYRDLYDFAPVGYLVIGDAGIIVETNLTAAKLLGQNHKDIIGKRFEKFVADEYKDLWYRHFQKAKHEQRYGCELPYKDSEGHHLYYHLDCMLEQDGEKPLRVRVTLTDVTERKRIEEQLKISAVAFDAQEGIFVTGPDHRIMRANKAFALLSGYPEAEAIGLDPATLFSLPGGLVEPGSYGNCILDALATKGHWRGEIVVKRKDGGLRPALHTLTATDKDGPTSHYVGTVVDITAHKLAEKILQDARERLESRVANSHEELEKNKLETAAVNTALNYLLKHREMEKMDAVAVFSREVEASLIPLLEKLERAGDDPVQIVRLVGLVKNDLKHLFGSYGRSSSLAAALKQLTPIERKVATMVRNGDATKVIATALNLSPKTIEVHRKHIRKKFGLEHQSSNLNAYLSALAE
jgi:PAS domain S-box-containing protein